MCLVCLAALAGLEATAGETTGYGGSSGKAEEEEETPRQNTERERESERKKERGGWATGTKRIAEFGSICYERLSGLDYRRPSNHSRASNKNPDVRTELPHDETAKKPKRLRAVATPLTGLP